MTKYFNFLMIAAFLFCGISCKNSELKSEINDDGYKKKISSNYDIPSYVSYVHNMAMYNFQKYIKENDINPFYGDKFSNSTYEEFAKEYVEKNLICSLNVDWTSLNSKTKEIDIQSLMCLEKDLSKAVLCSHIDSIKYVVDDIYAYIQKEPNSSEELLLLKSICNIACGSLCLWSVEWDWSQSYLIPDNLSYTQSNKSKDDNEKENDDEQKKKEEQEKLKEEKKVRQIAFADMMGAVAGAAGTGSVPGAAIGAIIGSLTAYGEAIIDETATSIKPEDVDPKSFFYDRLLSQYKADKDLFIKRYGTKFEGIIY